MLVAVRMRSVTDDPTLLIAHLAGPDRAEALSEALREEGRIPPAAIEVAVTPEETDTRIQDVQALVTGRLPRELLEAGDQLEWVHALSSGVDAYPLARLEERGVRLTNSAGIHAEPIAEQVLCYMLMFERRMPELVAQQAVGRWERREGTELRGKTLGVIGVGAVGTRVAELGKAVGMRVMGTKRDLDTMPAVVDEPLPAPDHRTLCRQADYVVLACPLTDETEGLIGMEEFRLMGEDTVLVNIARGDVCDHEALVRALQYHLIRGAALDVFSDEPLPSESPLWDLSNVIVTPHMAGSTPHKPGRWAAIVAENYERLVAGEDLKNRVV